MHFDLKKQALIASGLKGGNRLAAVTDKLEFLFQQFLLYSNDSLSIQTRAKSLFDWLWKQKPGRYRPNGNYRFDRVIEAQRRDGNHAVGNCLGLTLLYNCLLEMIGIQAEALHLQNGFGMGPHVLTLLKTGNNIIYIENILPLGFDYKGHLHDPSAERWGPKELVADIYHSRGNELFKRSQFSRALKNYDMALKLNPHYESARLNKAILKDCMNTAG
jgi:tetratricopeptide (TPR) repeat protein